MNFALEDIMKTINFTGTLANFTNINFTYSTATYTPAVAKADVKFTKVTNAFSGAAPFNGDGSNNKPVIFDINNDGYQDILFWWMKGAPVLGENYGGQPVTSQLQLLVNNGGKGFTDQTSKYFPNPNVDGWADSFVVHDFNRDGILDVVFATNREDGRNTDNPKDAATQLNALLSNSQTGTFENVKFGQSAWYFYINKFDIGGKTYIAASGSATDHSTQEVFTFESGKFTLANNILPEKSGSDPWQPFSIGTNYIFYDDDGDGSADTLYNPNARSHLIVNGVETEEFTFGIDAYVYDVANNRWSHSGSYFPMNEKKYVKDIEFTGWNYNKGVQPIFEYGPSTYSVGDDFYSTSTIIKLSPGGNNYYASLVTSTFFYAENIDNVKHMNQWDLKPQGYIAFFDIVNGRLEKVNVTVKGLENLDLSGANYMSTLDYNKDGYQDLVIYTWNKSNFPLVFLNDKNNSFYKFDEVVESKDYISASFFADFNNDGSLDVFSYISDGSFDIKTADMSQFDLYLGAGTNKAVNTAPVVTKATALPVQTAAAAYEDVPFSMATFNNPWASSASSLNFNWDNYTSPQNVTVPTKATSAMPSFGWVQETSSPTYGKAVENTDYVPDIQFDIGALGLDSYFNSSSFMFA